ncbi:MAG: ABC transporter permease, partial [Pseudomonadota bacterium]
QRVGVGRAPFHNRNIILLDDTLSAVDVGTEHKIMTNLITGTWSKATRILITHRMSALPFADKVYIMENGRLRLRDGTV